MEYTVSSFNPRVFAALVHLQIVALLLQSLLVGSSLGQEVTGIRQVFGPTLYPKSSSFSTRCKANEVVVVDMATVEQAAGPGASSCAEGGVPQDGKCFVDVRARLDELCSVRSNCEVRVQDLCTNSTCNTASAALNLTYSCLKVVNPNCRRDCSSTTLTSAEGYLASEVNPCGTSECPWDILVPPGQTIEITLYDFSGGQKKHSQQDRRTNSESSCVVIKERANPKEVQECIGRQRERERVLYTTVSNTIELRLIPKQEKFLLHYKAMGCPDIVPPYNSRMKRIGDRCEIDCPGSEIKWTLTCQDNAWTGKEKLEKCPGKYYSPGAAPIPQQKTDSGSEPGSSSSSSLPMSILIAAVVAITVIIAVLVLTIGFVCLKKHQYETKLGDPLLYGAPTSEFEFCADFAPGRPGVAPKSGTATIRSARSGARRSVELLGPVRDNTYAADKQLEMQPLHRPLPMIPGTDGRTGTWRPNDQKRIVVQLHHTGSGTMSVIPPYPTMMMRDGRLLPCNCGGTLRTHPSQLSVNRPGSHLYFTLDPEVQVEEPATLGRSYPAIEHQECDEDSLAKPRAAHQQCALASPPPALLGAEMNQRALAAAAAPGPIEMNHTGAMEMVPLNLTIPNRAKHANQVHQDNQIPLNLTPPHKKQNPIHEAHQNNQLRRNPSAGVEAHAH